MVCREVLNGGTEKIEKIRYVHEQQFFLLLKHKLPDAKIIYEECIFVITYDNGKTKGTIPDFFIKHHGGKRTIIEITTASKNDNTIKGNKNSKETKREIMKLAAPNDKYVILYRENLQKIQEHNPWVDFFGAKKLK